ncbi:MAG TPA: TonB-dependent receptor [Flavilitoribacter sp.]|nr:TonB-dependent receptor [Flavilitoribacter sp.]
MIDGVPVIGRLDGNIDLSQINLDNADRIEIIEGAMSAQYGSNASGGVVNIITQKSQTGQFRFQSRNQYESVGNWNNSLSLGARFGKLLATVSGNRYSSRLAPDDSLRLYETRALPSGETIRNRKFPWNPKNQFGIEGALRYNFSDSFYIRYTYRCFDEDLSIPGEKRRPQFKPYAFDEQYGTFRNDHSLQAEAWLNPRLYLNILTAYNDYERLKSVQRLDFEEGLKTPVQEEGDTTGFSSWLHRSTLSTTAKGRWNGQVGLEWLRESGAGKRIAAWEGGDQPVLSNYAGWIGLKWQAAGGLMLSGNVRYGYNSRYKHPVVPALHLSWQPGPDWTWRASYAHGFRAPSIKELYFNFIDVNHDITGNPDLEAERSRNASLSVDFNRRFGKKHRVSAEAKVFYNVISNRIILAEYTPARYNYQNLDRFETHGLNLRLAFDPTGPFDIGAGLAFTRLYNTWSKDTDADKYTGLFEMQNFCSVDIPGVKMQVRLDHRFIGKEVFFYEDEAGQITEGFAGGYHLIDAALNRFFWKDRIFLAAGVKNLLDVENIPLSGSSGGTHSSVGDSRLLSWGRAFFLRLDIALNSK